MKPSRLYAVAALALPLAMAATPAAAVSMEDACQVYVCLSSRDGLQESDCSSASRDLWSYFKKGSVVLDCESEDGDSRTSASNGPKVTRRAADTSYCHPSYRTTDKDDKAVCNATDVVDLTEGSDFYTRVWKLKDGTSQAEFYEGKSSPTYNPVWNP